MNSSKKTRTRKKRGFLRFALIVLGGTAAILALLYSYLSYMPTGYGRFEADLARRLGRPLRPTKEKDAQSPSLPKKRKTAFSIKPENLPGNSDDAPTTLSVPENSVVILDFYGFPEKLGIGDKESRLRKMAFRMENEQGYFNRNLFDMNENAEIIIEPSPEGEEALRELVRTHMACGSDQLTDFPKADFLKGLQKADADWGKGLDLLDPLTTKRDYVSPEEWVGRILMTCAARGDSDSAAKYLKLNLRWIQGQHSDSFFTGRSNVFSETSALFVFLGQMEKFSEEGFVSAREYFESIRGNIAQIEDYRALLAVRARDLFKVRLESHGKKLEKNAFHYFLSGVPQKAMHNFLLLALNRQADHLTMALARGETGEIVAEHKKMARLGTLMSFGRNWGLSSFNSNPLRDGFSFPKPPSRELLEIFQGVYANYETDFTRLVLEASHFRHARGRFPERIEDLVPEYLPPSFLPSSEGSWAILSMQRFRRPVVQEMYIDQGTYKTKDLFSQAVLNHVDHKRSAPTSLEDLKEYLPKDADLESFQDRFTWYEGRPVFFRFHFVPSEPGEKDSAKIRVDALWPNLILTPEKETHD